MQFYTLLAILGAIFFYLMVILLKASLTCVDDQGCLLLHCVEGPFSEDYKTLIETSIDRNSDCRYQLGTTLERTSNKYYFFNDFEDTCQADVNAYAKARFALEPQITDTGFDAKLEAALADFKANNADTAVASPSLDDAARTVRDRYTNYSAFVPVTPLGTLQVPTVETKQICQDAEEVKLAAQLLEDDVKAANVDGVASEFLDWATFKSSLNNCNEIWKDVPTICDTCKTLLAEIKATNGAN